MKDEVWCQTIFANLENGGVWISPRSGVVIQKAFDHLTWIAVESTRVSEVQNYEYRGIKERFALVGIPVLKNARIETSYKPKVSS